MSDLQTSSQTSKLCAHCGYDLRSQAAGVNDWQDFRCPECGHFPPVEHVPECRDPTILWHAGMALCFGVPLVLTALESARQRVSHASGGADWAPGWLPLLDLLGFIAIVWGTMTQLRFARNRDTFIVCGILFILAYVFALLFASAGIEWGRYRV